MQKNILYSLLGGLIFIALLVSQCKKEDDPLPFAIVNIRIEPNSTLFINLNAVGGYEFITANFPSRGVIVYRITTNEFKAFERTCPHDPDACCDEDGCSRLIVEDNGLYIKDECCESNYLILDGSNISGPSVKPLKQYNTSYDGKTLHIYN